LGQSRRPIRFRWNALDQWLSNLGPSLSRVYLGIDPHDRKARLVLAVDEALGDRTVGTPVRERKDLGAVPRDVDDSDSAVCDDAADKGAFGQALEADDGYPPVRSLPLVRGRDCHRSERLSDSTCG